METSLEQLSKLETTIRNRPATTKLLLRVLAETARCAFSNARKAGLNKDVASHGLPTPLRADQAIYWCDPKQCENERLTRLAVKDSGQLDVNLTRHQGSHESQKSPPRRRIGTTVVVPNAADRFVNSTLSRTS